MAASGWCPSGRLFEAAACGAAIVSDWWNGLDDFFVPGEEILIAASRADVIASLDQSDEALRRIGQRARERMLADHTSSHRAAELETLLAAAKARLGVPAPRLATAGA